MNIYLDIETIPCQLAGIKEDIAASMKPPGTLKKAESIAEWEKTSKPELVEEAWLKTSFDGGLGQIIAIAWAIDDGPVEWLYSPTTSPEGSKELLIDFFQDLKHFHSDKPTLIGHNIAGFDIPFLWKQAVVYNVKPPFWFPKNPKPWDSGIYDTMTQWDSKNFVSMDKLCKILGLPGKEGITGADVWPMALEGKFEEIGAYCAKDVERTRTLYKRMTFGG